MKKNKNKSDLEDDLHCKNYIWHVRYISDLK